MEAIAEKYKSLIREKDQSLEAFLDLADSLIQEGNIHEAWAAYTQAYQLGDVTDDRLKPLVTSLVDRIVKNGAGALTEKSEDRVDLFECGVCKFLWTDPVTVSCGHTFCRSCLEREKPTNCNRCGENCKFSSSVKINLLLDSITKKWFGDELEALRLKAKGNELFKAKSFPDAVDLYTQALQYCPDDHIILSNRSNALASSHQYQAALDDAERVIKLKPHWPKGYYRRGAALSGQSQHEDAAHSFLQCLSLNTKATSARVSLAECLGKIFSAQALEIKKTSPQSLLPHEVTLDASLTNTSYKLLDSLLMIQTPLKSTSEVPNISQKRKHSDSSTNDMGMDPEHEEIPTTDDIDVKEEVEEQKKTENVESKLEEDGNKPDSGMNEGRSNTSITVREVSQELRDTEDFECTLCYRIFYEPVTTPCGHNFCRRCLDRCLDYSSACPLCKSSLQEYLAERRRSVTVAVQQIVETYFSEENIERIANQQEEQEHLARVGQGDHIEIPIFVCTVGFPTMSCPLHIFEPRYRLMVRQCVEAGSRQFGMCPTADGGEAPFADWGCMLEVRNVEYMADGRSLVDTVGRRRFKVVSRSMRDGFHTGVVQYLTDTPEEVQDEGGEQEPTTPLLTLHDTVRTKVSAWFSRIPRMHQLILQQRFGTMPAVEEDCLSSADGPSWVWWAAAAIPVGHRTQLTLLGSTSLRQRLVAVGDALDGMERDRPS